MIIWFFLLSVETRIRRSCLSSRAQVLLNGRLLLSYSPVIIIIYVYIYNIKIISKFITSKSLLLILISIINIHRGTFFTYIRIQPYRLIYFIQEIELQLVSSVAFTFRIKENLCSSINDLHIMCIHPQTYVLWGKISWVRTNANQWEWEWEWEWEWDHYCHHHHNHTHDFNMNRPDRSVGI